MTKQEAIEYIKSNYPDSQRYEGLCEALDIAIECIQKDIDEEIKGQIHESSNYK